MRSGEPRASHRSFSAGTRAVPRARSRITDATSNAFVRAHGVRDARPKRKNFIHEDTRNGHEHLCAFFVLFRVISWIKFFSRLSHDAVCMRRAAKPRRVRLRGARMARQPDVLEVVNRGDAQSDVAPQSFADEPLVFQNARPLGARLRGRELHAREPL